MICLAEHLERFFKNLDIMKIKKYLKQTNKNNNKKTHSCSHGIFIVFTTHFSSLYYNASPNLTSFFIHNPQSPGVCVWGQELIKSYQEFA